jgi:antitoxin component of MazEF toxin-antitoxin module
MANKYPGQGNPVRRVNGSFVLTIPKDLARELEIEDGELPKQIEWDDDRELRLSF